MGKIVSDLFRGNLFKGDKGVWMIYFFLCMVSLVEVYSASSRLTFDGGHHWDPMLNQMGMLLAGLLVILLFHRIPCKWFMLFPFVALPISIVLLMLAAFGGGGEINGTNRWLSFMGFSFQPSEVAKLSLLMAVAVILSKTQAEIEVVKKGKKRKVISAVRGRRYFAFASIGIAALIVCGLIFMDNVSTAMMLFFVVILMMFIGNVPKDLMWKGLLSLMALGMFVGSVAFITPDETLAKIPLMKRMVTVKHRISRKFGDDSTKTYKLDGEASEKTLAIRALLDDKHSQETYAKIAVANSNFIGLGPGNSVERDFLQHAESDFIFAIIIEEMGIFGALGVAFLYLILLIRVGRIAQRCSTFFPAYTVIGLGIMMVLQAFVNMSVAVGLVPVTGQTLPLISKGGSSILITSFYIAVILSVSRYAEKKQQNAQLVAPVANAETSEYYTDGAMS